MNLRSRICATFLITAGAPLATGASAADPLPDPIRFNRHIRPILSENCFACHGFDQGARKADLRLDVRESALASTEGTAPIVPGDPTASELVRRILSSDPEEIMPPPKTRKTLTARDQAILQAWIAAGAEYEPHWAYTPPTLVEPPATPLDAQASNAIDHFVFRRLAAEGLRPSPPADPATLLRRLHLDLTGLPPTPEEVAAFVSDPSPAAWKAAVDGQLSSPHFGERLAAVWLDLVRYADTVGYHGDQPVSVYPYRDYVIDSFNNGKPFDLFTRENLAGDLFPAASTEQKIASGYNRLNMTTEEGGSQPKEYLAKYASDRVRTISSVWLGATVGCAECHDHKYDPYTVRDFYSLAAFFADIEEVGVYGGRGRPPELRLPTPGQQARLAEFDRQEGALKEALASAAEADRPEREKALQALAAEREAVEKTVASTLVTVAVPPRTMRILPRGNWLDDSGPEVSPAIPAFLGSLDTPGRRATRLDLADWLVSPENPLTARVFVNRLWKLYFGTGLSKVLDDLGSQGEWPTHPDLLDWLAVEFRDSGWDIKHVIRLIVTSHTYQQSSATSPATRERDPFNRLLARQSRFRLDAELVRDQALAVSGLLVRDVGGPSAKPYQPEGYYQHLNFPIRTYEPDLDRNQYRRGLYTHWQRTFLHPMLKAFDAPSRDECVANRPRSNTPLQALVLLNDPTFVESARALAARLLDPPGADFESRAGRLFRLVLARPPRPSELQILRTLHEESAAEYAANPSAAADLLSVGMVPGPPSADPVELAAWTAVCRAVLNLHETVTRL